MSTLKKLKIISQLKPRGDQDQAIEKLSRGIKAGFDFQTLLGVTGSGKTYTMAKVIEKTGKPTLIISPNKTLAAQLYEEFKGFFPQNEVCYFVSYYDYYQPEAYLPQTDTYIEKDSRINEEIDRLRHEAVQAVLSRRDAIAIASVSCIYNLGNPETYKHFSVKIKTGQEMNRAEFISLLLDLQYERNDYSLERGKFRLRGEFVDIWSAGEDKIFRIEIVNNAIKSLKISSAPFGSFEKMEEAELWPAKFWLSDKGNIDTALENIAAELAEHTAALKKKGKLIEAERIKRRTEYDIAMIRETGWCKGIENYSRQLEFRKPGSAPFTLLDYFDKDFLVFIDESHITVPQIGGMFEGDRSRKRVLIEHGFRLPSAIDNRPLNFKEFLGKINQAVFVSATPASYERQASKQIVEQIIRPTYLLDPSIEVRSTENQIKDLTKEIAERIAKKQRILVLTITKKLAEALADHLQQKKIKTKYLHSEIETLARPKILTELRKGDFDVLVGINLLREGLDLPEVGLIAIMDADKEGFLRNERSLVQIMGRASRNPEGHVVMYADNLTDSMKKAMRETSRRREIQEAYNKKHNILPQKLQKEIRDTLSFRERKEEKLPMEEFLKEHLKQLKYQLELARRNLQFEKAAQIKERMDKVRSKIKD